ncbi:uncharacterized protein LOC111631964 [Centruroides sculpturatus]|uniref:uncharacterized protein LOC111631964 n=1 Tax=Centruroides sculpturatus TaxID=218467 RepID=UPI000C6DE3CB|nr:uncharacterized protein LOC111631964 [Centruroides sculpturatus]
MKTVFVITFLGFFIFNVCQSTPAVCSYDKVQKALFIYCYENVIDRKTWKAAEKVQKCFHVSSLSELLNEFCTLTQDDPDFVQRFACINEYKKTVNEDLIEMKIYECMEENDINSV